MTGAALKILTESTSSDLRPSWGQSDEWQSLRWQHLTPISSLEQFHNSALSAAWKDLDFLSGSICKYAKVREEIVAASNDVQRTIQEYLDSQTQLVKRMISARCEPGLFIVDRLPQRDHTPGHSLTFVREKNAASAHQGVFALVAPESPVDPLASYERYAHANWDGDGAEPITLQTLEYARRLLRAMPTTFGPADIAPAADGSIALEWVPDHHHKLDKLFLDIGSGEEWSAYWLLRNGEFGRQVGRGYTPDTRRILHKLFDELSL